MFVEILAELCVCGCSFFLFIFFYSFKIHLA